jgi:hypothetical protein
MKLWEPDWWKCHSHTVCVGAEDGSSCPMSLLRVRAVGSSADLGDL